MARLGRWIIVLLAVLLFHPLYAQIVREDLEDIELPTFEIFIDCPRDYILEAYRTHDADREPLWFRVRVSNHSELGEILYMHKELQASYAQDSTIRFEFREYQFKLRQPLDPSETTGSVQYTFKFDFDEPLPGSLVDHYPYKVKTFQVLIPEHRCNPAEHSKKRKRNRKVKFNLGISLSWYELAESFPVTLAVDGSSPNPSIRLGDSDFDQRFLLSGQFPDQSTQFSRSFSGDPLPTVSLASPSREVFSDIPSFNPLANPLNTSHQFDLNRSVLVYTASYDFIFSFVKRSNPNNFLFLGMGFNWDVLVQGESNFTTSTGKIDELWGLSDAGDNVVLGPEGNPSSDFMLNNMGIYGILGREYDRFTAEVRFGNINGVLVGWQISDHLGVKVGLTTFRKRYNWETDDTRFWNRVRPRLAFVF